MAQESVAQESSHSTKGDEHSSDRNLLGPILCWAVVFADIGTSVYYTPGILYGTVGRLAGFFVFLTMTVFVLLTLKYAEVTERFPQGGGVVTVAAQAINHWVGALGGMFILVDYFLTAAISSLSGMLYLSVVIPAMGPFALEITIVILVLLGILNWVGVSESAKVSLVGAIIAFLSDIAILVTVFTHISLPEFFALFGSMFAHDALTPVSLLTGFAGSFLAFSGLESISQLSPVMKTPRKRVAGIALLLVVLTIGLTSPLLTMLSTLLLPKSVVDSPVLSAQVISLLGGKWGGIILQTEVAISASALLVFASNTAIIGSYHVFMALSRMEFFPAFVLKRNKLRGTPHYSIALATGVPIAVLIIVRGNINILGDMYAFGLLGAFTLTCIGLDIVRHRERKAAHQVLQHRKDGTTSAPQPIWEEQTPQVEENLAEHKEEAQVEQRNDALVISPYKPDVVLDAWHNFKYYIGIVTTLLVLIAWTTNLIAKPLATAFGGTVTLIGLAISFLNYRRQSHLEHVPVPITHGEERMPTSLLAVLTSHNPRNMAIIKNAITSASHTGRPVVFLFLGQSKGSSEPRLFEMHDPYYDDEEAQKTFAKAQHLAQQAGISYRFLYRSDAPGMLTHEWQVIHPHDMILPAEQIAATGEIQPDRVRYENTDKGKLAHLVKNW